MQKKGYLFKHFKYKRFFPSFFSFEFPVRLRFFVEATLIPQGSIPKFNLYNY